MTAGLAQKCNPSRDACRRKDTSGGWERLCLRLCLRLCRQNTEIPFKLSFRPYLLQIPGQMQSKHSAESKVQTYSSALASKGPCAPPPHPPLPVGWTPRGCWGGGGPLGSRPAELNSIPCLLFITFEQRTPLPWRAERCRQGRAPDGDAVHQPEAGSQAGAHGGRSSH